MTTFFNSKAYRHHLNVLYNELSCEELIESGLANPFREEEEQIETIDLVEKRIGRRQCYNCIDALTKKVYDILKRYIISIVD